MVWSEENSGFAGMMPMDTNAELCGQRMTRFDNRVHQMRFIRDNPDNWATGDMNAVHQGLTSVFNRVTGLVFD